MSIVWLAIFAAVGSETRYLLSKRFNCAKFPYGTLAANLIACALAGILLRTNAINESLIPIMAGLLGTLSTFSSMNFELLDMLVNKRYFKALKYFALSCAGIAIAAVIIAL